MRRAFTLVELLVVVAILALLLALLLPALGQARRGARRTVCQARLHGLGVALQAYTTTYADLIVPSYNMTGTQIGTHNPLDGWGPILDHERFAPGAADERGNAFYCPDTLPLAGMADAQTAADPDRPRGFMDWPAVLTLSQVTARPLPQRGFSRIVRVSYWINGENPIGRPTLTQPGVFYTASVGYGPDLLLRTLAANRWSRIRRPSATIALADGLYAGNQDVVRLGDRDLRIGYRHAGPSAALANVAFADGHVGALRGDRFPRDAAAGAALEAIRDENLGGQPTCYSDPERFLSP